MLKRIRSWASVLSLVSVAMTGTVLGTAAVSANAPSANAGLILAPIGVGILLVIVGVADQSLGMVILSNTDGTLKQDSLVTDLMDKYQTFGIDTQTAQDLGALISGKYSGLKPDAGGKVTLTLTRQELSEGLRATHIESDNPALFEQLVADLK